jgi:hypothetical protein
MPSTHNPAASGVTAAWAGVIPGGPASGRIVRATGSTARRGHDTNVVAVSSTSLLQSSHPPAGTVGRGVSLAVTACQLRPPSMLTRSGWLPAFDPVGAERSVVRPRTASDSESSGSWRMSQCLPPSSEPINVAWQNPPAHCDSSAYRWVASPAPAHMTGPAG